MHIQPSRLHRTQRKRAFFIGFSVITGMLLSFFLGVAGGWIFRDSYRFGPSFFSPFIEKTEIVKEKPLQKYALTQLAQKEITPSQIKGIERIDDTAHFTSYVFNYQAEGGTITGQLNVPQTVREKIDTVQNNLDPEQKKETIAKIMAEHPTIVMLRGYYPVSSYTTGGGTRNGAAAFASAGFITLAPDFLGYAGSDPEFENSWEARFAKPLQVIQLIKTLTKSGIPIENTQNQIVTAQVPNESLGMWGHSNGGQIALSVLQILSEPIPTTLWAPVTAPFPYSVLYFGLEQPDEGKSQRKWLSMLEEEYDVFDFSISKHMDRLTGNIQLHHGTADEATPISWSDTFKERITSENESREQRKKLEQQETDEKPILEPIMLNYYRYPGADHNMRPSWDTVVQRDITFFKELLLN